MPVLFSVAALQPIARSHSNAIIIVSASAIIAIAIKRARKLNRFDQRIHGTRARIAATNAGTQIGILTRKMRAFRAQSNCQNCIPNDALSTTCAQVALSVKNLTEPI